MFTTVILIAVAALVFYALADSLALIPSEKIGHNRTAVIALGAGIIPLLLLFAFPQLVGTATPYLLVLSVIAGALLSAWYLFVYKSLETEQVGNTMALIEIPYVMIAIFGFFILKEPVTMAEALGIFAIIIGVALVTTIQGKFRMNRKLIPALIGNIILGLFYITFIYAVTVSGSLAIPALVSRVIAFVIVVVDTLLFYKPDGHRKMDRKLNIWSSVFMIAVMVGIFDGIGELGAGSLALFNIVVLGGAIIAIEPILVALFGLEVYKERFGAVQILGIILAVAGAVLLNIL